jgi:hypothetical protein
MKFKENLYSIVTFNILEDTRHIFSCWSFYILVTDIKSFVNACPKMEIKNFRVGTNNSDW